MIYLILDVHYQENPQTNKTTASVAGIRFQGIAKNKFFDISEDYAVYRGISKHPLYVTSVDFDNQKALQIVKNLEGEHKLPNIVKMVDKLSRDL